MIHTKENNPGTQRHLDENRYRVNNCPSCGKYVRDVMVQQ